MQSPMQVLLKPLKVMMVECNAHSDILGFTNSMIALLCLPQFRRPVLWEEIELHKKPLVVLREIGFMHSMSIHGFMSGMCMKFLVKLSLWHVLPQKPTQSHFLQCNSQSEIIRVYQFNDIYTLQFSILKAGIMRNN